MGFKPFFATCILFNLNNLKILHMRISDFEGDSNPFLLIIDQVIITIRGKFNL